jgi:hypothetical protein
MKNLFLFLISILIISEVNAQCNNPFYQLKEGTIIQMKSFDAKDKLQSRSDTKVVQFDGSASGYIATIAYQIFDKKDKVISEGEYKLVCENGVIKIDMSSFMPAETMTAFKDMQVEVTMDQLNYPASMSVGQTLNDASMKISTQNSPIPMNMVFDITNRKVDGKESITTPAGTFDCFKISYNTHSKMMMANMNFTNVEYLSEKCGAVKTETYKSNGKLTSYTLLTKYEY